jgi:hypothetical protein
LPRTHRSLASTSLGQPTRALARQRRQSLSLLLLGSRDRFGLELPSLSIELCQTCAILGQSLALTVDEALIGRRWRIAACVDRRFPRSFFVVERSVGTNSHTWRIIIIAIVIIIVIGGSMTTRRLLLLLLLLSLLLLLLRLLLLLPRLLLLLLLLLLCKGGGKWWQRSKRVVRSTRQETRDGGSHVAQRHVGNAVVPAANRRTEPRLALRFDLGKHLNGIARIRPAYVMLDNEFD